jgi:hypothetical protein
MSNLRSFFDERKEEFNSSEPKDGHFDRFREKLDKLKEKRKGISFDILYKSAAAVIIILLSVLMYMRYENRDTDKSVKTAKTFHIENTTPEPEDYQEVEQYLKSSMEDKLNEFENIQCKNSDVDYKEIMNEIEELDKNYLELKTELENGMEDERIINAMIDIYQSKIELLNQVINQVNKNC